MADCTVVVVPTHGFGNRMRMLSSAHAYAIHHGCRLQAIWHTTLHMPTPWDELFATPLPEADDALLVRHANMLYNLSNIRRAIHELPATKPDECEAGPPGGHTQGWIDGIDPHAPPRAVLLVGGHVFLSLIHI